MPHASHVVELHTAADGDNLNAHSLGFCFAPKHRSADGDDILEDKWKRADSGFTWQFYMTITYILKKSHVMRNFRL